MGGKISHAPKARRHDMLRSCGQAMQAKVGSLVRTKEALGILVVLSGVGSKYLGMQGLKK